MQPCATVWAALIIYTVRLAGIWLGCWVGAEVGGTPPDVSRRLWMGMVTQAGIALGLAQTVAARFPSWGPDYAGKRGSGAWGRCRRDITGLGDGLRDVNSSRPGPCRCRSSLCLMLRDALFAIRPLPSSALQRWLQAW